MFLIQLFSSMIALFVRIELLCRLPPNRPNGEAVFEGSPTVGKPSETDSI